MYYACDGQGGATVPLVADHLKVGALHTADR